MKRESNKGIVFLAFAMYFLSGAACIVVGSSLPQLVELYQMEIDRIVLFSSAYAAGRVSTVYLTGRIVEKTGPLKILAAGVGMIAVFLYGLPTIINYYAALGFAFLGGIGMGTKDAVCPVLLSRAFPGGYARAMSAGQAFFGIGNFATPFLIGIMIAGKLPFYYSYYILLFMAGAILISIPFIRFETQKELREEQQVKPLFVKNRGKAYLAVVIVCMAYSAVVNTLMTYISSFAEGIGMGASEAAFMLTAYNVGSFVGAVAFIGILKRVKELTVLIGNQVAALAVMLIMLIQKETVFYCIGITAAGFFLGVLFNLIVTAASRMDYKHVSRASSMIGMTGGISDIMTPAVTGVLVSAFGIGISFKYAILMLVIAAAAAVILQRNTEEKELIEMKEEHKL